MRRALVRPVGPVAKEAADPAMAAQKAAFLALPESKRKAAQDALVWLGSYNGVADGDLGKRTRDAIVAFQASIKASANGALSVAELQALLAAAQKARDAVGFRQRRQDRRALAQVPQFRLRARVISSA